MTTPSTHSLLLREGHPEDLSSLPMIEIEPFSLTHPKSFLLVLGMMRSGNVDGAKAEIDYALKHGDFSAHRWRAPEETKK